MTVSQTQRPPPHPFYGEYSHRGKDPWHRNAFPEDFKDAAPLQTAEQGEGWYLTDAWGNEIDFVPDGIVYPNKEKEQHA